ncbi:D-alanyl-D-alanine carboxypeptidase/D-alanyl-D-alanine-endopeptidase [Pedobacter yulinensis]|uniref:D-alanyl-D-alanine carboxypeptidase/D-alanyl-D-alanine-endopeptidase n=1 Tax=Pedobacter yulinensis TaxID=2126353 RepID=A0A2T3HQA4_9SPHI|nr:D-alanyl-D-alanine carboxypeptidase/D-alanyl-D-alanine-endopeptidase [Pedobacter yulinensis]PST84606.1 D-alanyl-D-alanine carboxypeptidase/D-alanyl-D-alanine-endopeptidase [Pedobacter yulinensis]
MHFRKIFCLLIALAPLSAMPQNRIENVEKAFERFLADEQCRYASASLCVLDAASGKLLYGANEHTGLATASTLKTITAATAFSLLGKDFRYQTTLGYSGRIENGVLKGDLIITGGGDPTLGSWRYEQSRENVVLSQWVAAIRAAGIREISGTVIGDDSAWGTQTTPDGWTWQEIGNYYGAGASALSWRENQFDIHLRAANASVIKAQPEMPYIRIVNELKTGAAGSGDNAYAYLPPFGNLAYLRGTWASDIRKSGISVALPDPAYDCAYRLQDTMKRLGIRSAAATTSRLLALEQKTTPPVVQKLSTITSPSLSEIVYWFEKKSINLFGEHLLRTLAWKSGRPAGTREGARTLVNFWAEKGIDRNALNIVDGSGLSPANRVTTRAMATILFQAQKESWFADFYKALPEYNGMKIKSGTISDVSAFAGYHTDRSGNKYVVVINVNNYSGSGINRKLFQVLDALK